MHVAVLGAGYAGLTLTRRLERELSPDATLTLVDASPNHLVQHELHRVIRRPELARGITVPLADAVDADVRVARVESVDPENGEVALSRGTLSYDVGAVCLGARTAFYGLDGVREHAIPLKRLAHAERIRREFFRATDHGDPQVVVGGAGLSGVQVAGELAELAREEGVDPEIVLVERLERVAPGFPPAFSRAVREALERKGVEVRAGETVRGADADRVDLASGELAYDVFVWTGGIRGADALGERPTVRSDLRLAPRTFGLGDAVRAVDADGEAVPASAQSAVREARTVAENVSRLVAHDREGGEFEPRLEPFTFDSPGWLVSVGDDAVAQVGSSVVTGRAATALKTTVGVGYLSSVGAVGNAIDLVSRELGRRR
ncbi:NAD(P)/FAD-dependent oxidoreductase [Saliphagus infecundisoli]|uniref:NAD(P)/FAD-dependent oxidoreductase n=1 Tax=Saliphagus infecundisoli TaxID=1849069 RepID=A0ABD5QEK1_9EURY|nr:FAD-dependent oxidoreductase [Saliphagus infecundisoli]